MKSTHYLIAVAICAVGATACSKSAKADRDGDETTEGAPNQADNAKIEAVLARGTQADTSAVTGGKPTAALMPTGGAAPVAADEGAVVKKAPAAKTPMGKGVTITKEWYTLTIDVPDGVKSGAKGVVNVTLVPRNGRKINQEFPTKLTVDAPAGVKVDKPKQKKGDATYFSEKKASFKVAFTSTAAGEKAFSGKFKFAVCTDATCDPKTEKLAFRVAVQ
jgi:hypothetical protein